VTAKVVVVENEDIVVSRATAYRTLPRQAAAEVFERTMAGADLSRDQVAHCLATGSGRKVVGAADGIVSEAIAVSRAIRFLDPDVRTVISIGGQSILAFSIGADGRVLDSAANEKCAAGTGRFMDVMARALEMPLEQLSESALAAGNAVPITSQCGVFAESEVITHVNDGRERADIFAGIARSVAVKISSIARRIDVLEPLVLVGGVAKSAVVRRGIEDELGIETSPAEIDPQLVGALGAAMVAQERHREGQPK